MRAYFARTAITMLRALIMILMAPAFIIVFICFAVMCALLDAYEWMKLHADYNGDEKAKHRDEWRAL